MRNAKLMNGSRRTFAFLIFNFAFPLLLAHMLGPEVFEKLLQVVGVVAVSGLDAEQDAAAANARVVDFGAVLGNACTDERADDAARGGAGAGARERGRNRPG